MGKITDEIKLEFTPLEFETWFDNSRSYTMIEVLEFTPLEFETT